MSSFGESHRRERELRGIKLPGIAEATKISVRFLEALETNRFDLLPGGIFRRSFVKAYASHLGLDADRTVSEFLAAQVDCASAATSGAPAAGPSAQGSLYPRPILGLTVTPASGP